jgi:hypothetical protein
VSEATDQPDGTAIDDFPEAYRPVRDAIRTVRRRSLASCGDGDRKRAAEQMGRLIGGKAMIANEPASIAALLDLAMFEPNDRGVRPIDRFLAGPARQLPPLEQDIARRMGAAWFSLFRIVAPHEENGVLAEDILDQDRRLRIIELSLNDEKALGHIFGIRLFDAGPFCAMTGPASPVIQAFVETCLSGLTKNGALPFSRSLAAMVYGMIYLAQGRPTHPGGMKFARDLYEAIERSGKLPARTNTARSA